MVQLDELRTRKAEYLVIPKSSITWLDSLPDFRQYLQRRFRVIADEAERDGKRRITPYWRTLKAGGELNPKYPGGLENLRSRLEAEGHKIVQKGKRFFVAELG